MQARLEQGCIKPGLQAGCEWIHAVGHVGDGQGLGETGLIEVAGVARGKAAAVSKRLAWNVEAVHVVSWRCGQPLLVGTSPW